MIFLFIIKPRVKKVRNTIHDIPVYNQTSCKKSKKSIHDIVYNQTSCKKVRNTIHDIPVYNQTSCKKVRNRIHGITVYYQTLWEKSKKYNS